MLNWRKFKQLFTGSVAESVVAFPAQTVERLREKWLGRRADQFGASQFDNDGCGRVVALLKQSQPPVMPADLAFRIRQRIARERAMTQRPTWTWRWSNRLAPFAVPAAAGLLSAVVIFGIFVRIFEIPVQANSSDVPLQFRTPPRLLSTALMESYTGIECMKVKVLIDENGRVADISILQGKQTPEQVRNLEYLMLFTLFNPATVFGKPTSDTVTLKLRDGYLESITL